MARLSLAAAAALIGAAAAQGGSWTQTSTEQCIAIGIDMANGTLGYMAAGVNGVGYGVWTTYDGSKTFAKQVDVPNALMLLDIASYGESVVATGTLAYFYSLDGGNTWNQSTLEYAGASQYLATIGEKENEVGYAAVGSYVESIFQQLNGVSFSYDDGETFNTTVNITQLNTFARTGAWPSPNVGFVAAGQWPGMDSDDNGGSTSTSSGGPSGATAADMVRVVRTSHYINAHQIPEGSRLIKAKGARVHLIQTPSNDFVFGYVKGHAILDANAPFGSGPNITTYWSQVAKTSDGGASWTKVYDVFNQYYPNDFFCWDVNNCCFVAEAVGNGGSHVFCTANGGSSWNQTYYNSDPDSSLVGISAVSATEWHIVGGEFTALGVKSSSMFSSFDGGKSWSQDASGSFDGLYAMDVDCVPSAKACWAVMNNQFAQSTAIAMYSQ